MHDTYSVERGRIAAGAVSYNPNAASGLNRYTGEVVGAMLARDPQLIAYSASNSFGKQGSVGAVRLLGGDSLSRNDFGGNVRRLLWHQLVLPSALKRDRISVFYSPVAEGMVAPPCRQVITIHDLLPLRFPESNPRLRYYFQYVLPRVARASSALIAVSESTERDIRSYLRLPDVPIHVVYQGYKVDVFRPMCRQLAMETAARYGLKRFVLAVGETRPYKNIHRLIQAFARLPDPDLQLAVVGKANRLSRDLSVLPDQLNIAGRVKFLDIVPDPDLAALYNAADVFAFPSLYEGFGIPPLEAMACGCPVVASELASVPEVCGNAAVYVDPYDVDAIAAALTEVTRDSHIRETLRQRGLDRCRQFSYGSTADRVLAVLRDHTLSAPIRRYDSQGSGQT